MWLTCQLTTKHPQLDRLNTISNPAPTAPALPFAYFDKCRKNQNFFQLLLHISSTKASFLSTATVFIHTNAFLLYLSRVNIQVLDCLGILTYEELEEVKLVCKAEEASLFTINLPLPSLVSKATSGVNDSTGTKGFLFSRSGEKSLMNRIQILPISSNTSYLIKNLNSC